MKKIWQWGNVRRAGEAHGLAVSQGMKGLADRPTVTVFAPMLHLGIFTPSLRTRSVENLSKLSKEESSRAGLSLNLGR